MVRKEKENKIKVIKYCLGQLQANCYFLIYENDCIIIDPADEAFFILEELQRKKLKLICILATHGHFDHIMAAGEIQKSFNVPFYIFREDLFLVKRVIETAEYFLGYKPIILQPSNIKFLEQKKLRVASFELQVLSTPGHTPGSCCFYFKNDKVAFTGDTLFKQGIGRYDFSYSNKTELYKSLKEILKLPKDTFVCPGHGDDTTIENELRILNQT